MTITEKIRMLNSSFEYAGKSVGFYPTSEDGFSTNRIPTLFLNNNSVGIMTDNPKATLDVRGMTITETIRMLNSAFQYAGESVSFYPTSEDGLHAIRMPTLFFNYDRVGIMTDNPTAALSVNGSTHITGKVGIGTISPEFPLDVNGDANFKNKIRTDKIYFPGPEMRIGKITEYFPPEPGRDLGDDPEYSQGDDPINGDDPDDDQEKVTGELIDDIITIKSSGRVGIGTTNPTQTFHVFGTSYLNGATHISGNLGIGTTSPTRRLHVNGDGCLSGNFGIGTTNPEKKLHVDGDTYLNGSVGIGVMNTNGYKLSVNGKINCTEVVVTTSVSKDGDDGDEWPDYVFAEDYALRSLDEVASYIQENKRLPEIPSAAEVSEKGINLLEINTLLLKKVEELTLYILQQNEKMTDLQSQINDLKK